MKLDNDNYITKHFSTLPTFPRPCYPRNSTRQRGTTRRHTLKQQRGRNLKTERFRNASYNMEPEVMKFKLYPKIITHLTKLDELFTLSGLIDWLKEVSSDRWNWLRGRLWGQHWRAEIGKGLASRVGDSRIIVSESQQNKICRGQRNSTVIKYYY